MESKSSHQSVQGDSEPPKNNIQNHLQNGQDIDLSEHFFSLNDLQINFQSSENGSYFNKDAEQGMVMGILENAIKEKINQQRQDGSDGANKNQLQAQKNVSGPSNSILNSDHLESNGTSVPIKQDANANQKQQLHQNHAENQQQNIANNHCEPKILSNTHNSQQEHILQQAMNQSQIQQETKDIKMESQRMIDQEKIQGLEQKLANNDIEKKQTEIKDKNSQAILNLQHEPRSRKELRNPTQQELCSCILTLKEMLPECPLQKVIRMLYDNLIVGCNESQALISSPKDADQTYHKQEISATAQKQLFQEPKGDSRTKSQQQSLTSSRQQEERQVASLFIDMGYGYPKTKQVCSFQLYPNKYNNLVTAMVKNTFRKLQDMIRKLRQEKKLPELACLQQKNIRTPLIRYKQWLGKDYQRIFERLIQMTYQLPCQPVGVEQSIRIYQAITAKIQQFKVRGSIRGTAQTASFSPQNFWSKTRQEQFCRFYLHQKKLSQVRQLLIEKYPSLSEHFSPHNVKCRFQKILKHSFKKLLIESKSCSRQLPPLKLNQEKARRIMRETNASEARVSLITFYLDKQTNFKNLSSCVESINRFSDANQEAYAKASTKERISQQTNEYSFAKVSKLIRQELSRVIERQYK